MNLYKDSCDGPLEISSCQDPDEILDYTFYYAAPDWAASTEYFIGDVVYPTTKSGIYLEVTQPGVSGSTEPTWSTKKSAKATDNTVIWKTVVDPLALQTGETIVTSVWTITGDVPTANGSVTDYSTRIWVGPVPTGVTSFTLTNTIETDSSPVRTFERSIIVSVDEK